MPWQDGEWIVSSRSTKDGCRDIDRNQDVCASVVCAAADTLSSHAPSFDLAGLDRVGEHAQAQGQILVEYAFDLVGFKNIHRVLPWVPLAVMPWLRWTVRVVFMNCA